MNFVLHAQFLPLFSGFLAIVTILVCYTLAVLSGHTAPFPNTDITHCALGYPERFVFRIGMIPSMCGMVAFWFLVYGWIVTEETRQNITNSSNLKILQFGVLGAICLIIASSVLESDGSTQWTIHIIFAVSFFLFTTIAQVLTSKRLGQLRKINTSLLTESSYNVKLTCNLTATIILFADILFSIVGGQSWMLNVCEWTLTFIILIYTFTFYNDFRKNNIVLSVTQSPSQISYNFIPSLYTLQI